MRATSYFINMFHLINSLTELQKTSLLNHSYNISMFFWAVDPINATPENSVFIQ